MVQCVGTKFQVSVSAQVLCVANELFRYFSQVLYRPHYPHKCTRLSESQLFFVQPCKLDNLDTLLGI